MMRRILAVVSVAAGVLLAPVLAGFAIAGGAGSGASQADLDFARRAALGGLAEVAFARLAEQKAQDAAVIAFAGWMARDHSRANAQLAALAAQEGLELPGGMDEAHRARYDQLRLLQGAAFDRGYIQSQIEDHRAVIRLLEAEIASGEAPRWKAFAASRLPISRHHLTTAWDVGAKMPGIDFLLGTNGTASGG